MIKFMLVAATVSALNATAMANDKMMADHSHFTVSSPTIAADGALPQKQYWNNFGCSGGNVSPALTWRGVPKDTKSFAITFYDHDAPTGSGFWHWVAYNIPATVTNLEEGAASMGKLPAGAVEGNTDLGKPGWFGPCPPPGRKHHYTYTVYALNTDKLDLPGATAAFVGFNLWQHTLATATLTATAGPR
ncbi:MAG: YbhB/YbcL family Raf kinase inhibitor-like protein [Gammaproteobacteria bacterium]|nr:YbhB/YbcL family Raf kinase inhibitor-like protein [Gammaproteobacteria bacterium]